MIRLFISAAVLIAVAGCATSAPQATTSAPDNSANVVVANVQNDSDSLIDVIEVPEVHQTTVVKQRDDELICHREHVTGTHRTQKICRRRSDIDATRESTQRALRKMSLGTGAAANSD